MSEVLTHKPFSTEAVVTAYTGRMACGIGELYEILGFLLDDDLFTHQLPAASNAVKPHLEQQFPWLAEIELPSEGSDIHLFGEAIAAIVEERSDTLIIKRAPEGIWKRGNAIQDLADMIGDKPMTIIVSNEEQGGV